MNAMHILISTWNNVTATTISNGFRKACLFIQMILKLFLWENKDKSPDFNTDDAEWNNII